jgi:uncharacterized repeat protein (TIGR01451 family)
MQEQIVCTPGQSVTPYDPSKPNSGRWEIQMVVRATDGQSINNTASVASTDLDPDTSNNFAEVEHQITDVADLGIVKTADATIVAGHDLTYTLNVTNNGPSAAQGVTVMDSLPAGVTFVSAVVTIGTGSCALDSPAGLHLTCTLGNIASGESAQVVIVVHVDKATAPGTLYNSACVTSQVFDNDNSNDCSSTTTTVIKEADLKITKTQSPVYAYRGNAITFTLVVENLGPGNVVGAHVVDNFTASLINVTWTCKANVSQNDSAFTHCGALSGTGSIDEYIDIQVGKIITYTVTTTNNDYDASTNTATVYVPDDVFDPDLANNTSSVTNQIYALWMPEIANHVYDHVYAPNLIITDFQAGPHGISVTIKNVGLAPVMTAFWVDVYLDPQFAPTGPNMIPDGYQWGSYGHAQFRIPASPANPFIKDQTLTLTLAALPFMDPYWSWQQITWPLPTNINLWAQVDSYGRDSNNAPVWYGSVLETHEIENTVYDNIAGPIHIDPNNSVDP